MFSACPHVSKPLELYHHTTYTQSCLQPQKTFIIRVSLVVSFFSSLAFICHFSIIQWVHRLHCSPFDMNYTLHRNKLHRTLNAIDFVCFGYGFLCSVSIIKEPNVTTGICIWNVFLPHCSAQLQTHYRAKIENAKLG